MTTTEHIAELLLKEQVTYTKLADQTGILLLIDGLEVLSLNETAVFLVEAIKGGARSEEQLVAALRQEFEVDEATAKRDVVQFVDTLARHLTA
jgi:hypothetical protein